MVKAVGVLAMGVLACGWAAAAQAFEVKQGFQCRIEITDISGDVMGTETTYDSARICADSYVSVTCRTQLDPTSNPPVTRADVACQVDTDPCGFGFGVQPADLSTLKIDDEGLAVLNCLRRTVL